MSRFLPLAVARVKLLPSSRDCHETQSECLVKTLELGSEITPSELERILETSTLILWMMPLQKLTVEAGVYLLERKVFLSVVKPSANHCNSTPLKGFLQMMPGAPPWTSS